MRLFYREQVPFLAGILMLGIFFLALFFSDGTKRDRIEEVEPTVRVLIARGPGPLNIVLNGRFHQSNTRSERIVGNIAGNKVHLEVKVSSEGLKADGYKLENDQLSLRPLEGSTFFVDGVEYGGGLDVIVSGRSLMLINHIGVESYLKGVLPRETYDYWPFEALKAQAVASRSYALFEARRRRNRPYDLTSDMRSQVYGGKSAERYRTTRAVDETRSEVIFYGGELVPGYFHASCGGHTTRVSKVWGGPDMEPFRGVRSPYCRIFPASRWRSEICSEEIRDSLSSRGHSLDGISSIKMGRSDVSGRSDHLEIRYGKERITLPMNDMLNAIGRTRLRSSNFRVRKRGDHYEFSGRGWGHGVGMCQWCTLGLSLARRGYKRILRHFYPGTRVGIFEG